MVAGDNLRKGAALNAKQIAELLLEQPRSLPDVLAVGVGYGIRCGTGSGRNASRSFSQHLGALALEHRLQPAELEPAQLDASLSPQRPEAEVGEEVARKDRAVHLEALVGGLALGIAVRERLDRGRALLARSPIAVRKSDCITHGVDRSTRYAHVIRNASLVGGPAGSSCARGKNRAGPNCIEPSRRPSSSW